jgi:hypothetical protein
VVINFEIVRGTSSLLYSLRLTARTCTERWNGVFMMSLKVICLVIVELSWKFQQGGQSPLAIRMTDMLPARIIGRVITLCFPTAERGRLRLIQQSVAGGGLILSGHTTSIGRAQKYASMTETSEAICCYSRLLDVIPPNSGVKTL